MPFLGLTIRSRLYWGFGAIVAFALALSAFSGQQLSTVKDEVATTVSHFDEALRAREIAEDLQAIRRADLRFSVDADAPSFKEAEERESKAIETLRMSEAATHVEERRVIYRTLEKSVLEMRAKREALGAIIALKLAGRDALFTGGDQLTAATIKLVDAARDDGDHAIVQGAANLETAVLLTRVTNWRFLATLDPKGVANFSANVDKTRQQIAILQKTDLPKDVGPLLTSVDAALANYATAFEKTSTNTLKASDAYGNGMRPLAIAGIDTINSLAVELKQEQQTDEIQSASTIASTITVQEVVAALTILLGGLIAFFVAGAISGPLKAMCAAMKQLASGDLEVTIPAQDKKDEIGEMAKAVLVFQTAAVENARLERAATSNRAQAEGERAGNERAQREAIEQERAIVANSIGTGLTKLAAKDLTFRMSSDIPDAYRKLQTDFNAAIEQLEGAMQSVGGSADAIQAGTHEISTASDDLSRRTEQQAASLEETAAALDEITATVKKSAEGAKHAREVVASADQDAKKSAVVVRQAVEAMAAIAKSSGEISQIIGVIDEIAFQTNLLALNAGVEAARAGDAGRGFAVVASEVRALAQRSADAAKEIKGLISTSTTQVDFGVELVAETGKSLERIIAQVTEINGVVAEIAAGALEQATGLQQVNTAINQMDQTTQQNATMVEQSTAASHSLSQETAQLSSLIGEFQVGRTGDNSMRRQLQKAAPHAFRASAKAPAAIGSSAKPRAVTSNSRPAVRKEAAAPARAAPKAVANGADGNSWEEF